MGACDFYTKAKGKTAQEAFNSATEQARWESGNGGYTGTIAEKHSFKMVTKPTDMTIDQFTEKCFDTPGHVANDKWGPAACLDLGNGEYLFFGLASS